MVATCGRFLRKKLHFLDCHCLCEQKRKELEGALVARIGLGLPDPSRLSHTRTTHYFRTTVSVGLLHETATTGSVLVEYQEYQGLGPPGDLGRDFGSIGDTYVDLTPNKHNLYAKISQLSWEVWPGPMVASNGLKHPIYPKLYLRCKPKKTGRGYVQDIGWHVSFDYVDYQLSAHDLITKALECRVQRGPAPKHGLRAAKRKLLSDSQQCIESKKPRMKSMINNTIAQDGESSSAGNQALITLANHGHTQIPEEQNSSPAGKAVETQQTMNGQSAIFTQPQLQSCDQPILKSPTLSDADLLAPQGNDTINLNSQSPVTVSGLDLHLSKTSLCEPLPATRHSPPITSGDMLTVAHDNSLENCSTSRSPTKTLSQIPTSIEAPCLSLPISSDHNLAVAACSSSDTTTSQMNTMVAPCQSVPLSPGEMLIPAGCNLPENACSAPESSAPTTSQVSITIAASCPSPSISSSETAIMASRGLAENAYNTLESPTTTSSQQIPIQISSGQTLTLTNCSPPQSAYEAWRSPATTVSQPIHSLPISSRDILAIASTKSSRNACRVPRCSNTTPSRIPSAVHSDEASYIPVIEINRADLTVLLDKLNIVISANDAGLKCSKNAEVNGVEGDKYVMTSHACEKNIQDLTASNEHTTNGQLIAPIHFERNRFILDTQEAPSCSTQNIQVLQTESTTYFRQNITTPMDMDKLSFSSIAFAPPRSTFACEEPIPASPTSIDFDEYLMPQSPLVEKSHSTSPGAVEPSFLPPTHDAAVGDSMNNLVEKAKPDNQIGIEPHKHSSSRPVESLEMLPNTETDTIPIDEETKLHSALQFPTPILPVQDGVDLLSNEPDTAFSGNNLNPVHGDGDSESVSSIATPSVQLNRTAENEKFEETLTQSQLEQPETQPPDSNNLNHRPPRASSQPKAVLCQGFDGINEEFTPTISSKCQLKEIHISVLFAEYSTCLLCRICLATCSAPRVFKVKSDSPQTVHAIQQHCYSEHAEDCEVLTRMPENELQDLCTQLSVCMAGKQAPAGTDSQT